MSTGETRNLSVDQTRLLEKKLETLRKGRSIQAELATIRTQLIDIDLKLVQSGLGEVIGACW